jgi:uncharacterized protein YqcC (DUF446 family)
MALTQETWPSSNRAPIGASLKRMKGRKRALVSLIAFAILMTASMQFLSRSKQIIAVPAICVAMIFVIAMALNSRRADGPRGSIGKSGPDYAAVAAHIDQIEQEMKRVGLWQEKPLAPEQYNFTQAFAMDTMSYDQWLQFIFVPRVKEIIRTEGSFPASSSVGAQAVREFDTYPDSERLITLLSEFDGLFRG